MSGNKGTLLSVSDRLISATDGPGARNVILEAIRSGGGTAELRHANLDLDPGVFRMAVWSLKKEGRIVRTGECTWRLSDD